MASGAAGCGANSANPIQPPPPPQGIQLSCPLAISVEATSSQGADIHFDAATPTTGLPPHTVECTPGSGSTFPIGDTTVRCVGTDANKAQGSCEFTASVRVARTLTKTRYTAFGDSIAEGKVSLAPLISLALPDAFPGKLEALLSQRYVGQTIVVSNQGISGERLDKGAQRLPTVLASDQPEVVLILEGVNAVWIRSTSAQAADLRSMIVAARNRNVDVILATLMPVTAEWENAGHQGAMSRITALNARIFALGAEFKSPVVDLFSIFKADMRLIGQDGLHPTVAGQARIAEAFADEIARQYGTEVTMTSGGGAYADKIRTSR